MRIEEVDRQDTLAVRRTVDVKELPQVMGEVYGKIAQYASSNRIAITGAPFAMYHNMDMEALDIEIGFPVQGQFEGEGEITCGSIPEGRIATAIHEGPYATMEQTYSALSRFVEEQQIEVYPDWMYEYYLNSPLEVPQQELRTKICFIIR